MRTCHFLYLYQMVSKQLLSIKGASYQFCRASIFEAVLDAEMLHLDTLSLSSVRSLMYSLCWISVEYNVSLCNLCWILWVM